MLERRGVGDETSFRAQAADRGGRGSGGRAGHPERERGVVVAGERRCAASLRLRLRSVRRRPAPRDRRRRRDRGARRRSRRRDGHVRRHGSHQRQDSHDPDRRRILRHGDPPRRDRRAQGRRRCRGAARRYGGEQWYARAQSTVRPPRDSGGGAAGGIRRPARPAAGAGGACPSAGAGAGTGTRSRPRSRCRSRSCSDARGRRGASTCSRSRSGTRSCTSARTCAGSHSGSCSGGDGVGVADPGLRPARPVRQRCHRAGQRCSRGYWEDRARRHSSTAGCRAASAGR